MENERLASQCRRGCVYAAKVSSIPICDYLGITGRVRPCPPGRDCSEWADEKKGGALMPRKAMWDVSRAKALLDEGQSVEDIAAQVGTTVAALKSWMQRKGYSGQKQERFRLQEPSEDKQAELAPRPSPPDKTPAASEVPAAAVEADRKSVV